VTKVADVTIHRYVSEAMLLALLAGA